MNERCRPAVCFVLSRNTTNQQHLHWLTTLLPLVASPQPLETTIMRKYLVMCTELTRLYNTYNNFHCNHATMNLIWLVVFHGRQSLISSELLYTFQVTDHHRPTHLSPVSFICLQIGVNVPSWSRREKDVTLRQKKRNWRWSFNYNVLPLIQRRSRALK